MLSHDLLDAVRVEITGHESAIAKLREIERLTLELGAAAPEPPAPAPSPAARAPQRPRRGAVERKHRLPLTEQEAAPAIRDAIADGPCTETYLLREVLGRSANTHTRNVLRRVLEELRAERDAGGRWRLTAEPDPPGLEPAPAAALDDPEDPARDTPAPEASRNGHGGEEIDRAYLDRVLLRELRRSPLSVERAAERVDAPVEEVLLACQRLRRRGEASEMSGGLWCA